MSSAALILLAVPGALWAQVSGSFNWRVDPQSSLVWWQLDPNYGHLWATTCPDDPSWQPGEGRSTGTEVDYSVRRVTAYAGHHDERVPLYPRGDVHPVCRRAVNGSVEVEDTIGFKGVRGDVLVLPDSLFLGLNMRDKFSRRKVFETQKYPEMRFRIDSLVSVQAGDTVRAEAVGGFVLRGVETPLSVPVRAWWEASGLRVVGQWQMSARDLIHVYGMSKWALGMGVTLGRWKTLHMGLDVILRPGTARS